MSSGESTDSSESEGTVDYPDTPNSTSSSSSSYAQFSRRILQFDDNLVSTPSLDALAAVTAVVAPPSQFTEIADASDV